MHHPISAEALHFLSILMPIWLGVVIVIIIVCVLFNRQMEQHDKQEREEPDGHEDE